MKSIVVLLALIGICTATDSYMHVLAQEWPGSVCKFENCQAKYMGKFDNRRWNLHGLWPDTVLETTCGQIGTCTTEKFDADQLSADTKALVDLTWNGMYSDTNSFRKHEWEKHGTCYVPKKNQNNFFSMVGGMALNYNFYEILGIYGIYPDNSRQLTDRELRAAFAPVIGADSSFTYLCSKDSAGKFYLSEVRICFNEAMKPRTCSCKIPLPTAFVSCGAQFYYPLYSLTDDVENINE